MPATTAAPIARPDTFAVASTTTPEKPTSNANARRGPIFSPKNRKPISAANSTVIALQIAPIAAGARSAAQANSTNGNAEFTRPMGASHSQRRAGNCARARHRNGISTSAPSSRRTSTSAYGPKSGTAMRMNRNDEPQTMPRPSSSSGVAQSRAAGAGVAPLIVHLLSIPRSFPHARRTPWTSLR